VTDETEMEPGQYMATLRDDVWELAGVCGLCRERLTHHDNPVVVLPSLSFEPPDYKRALYRKALEADSGIFHAKCAQRRFRDESERLPEALRPRHVLVWPDPDGVLRYESDPHDPR
jgi:hypothetical protein